MARPKKSAHEKRGDHLHVRLTTAERVHLDEIASSIGLTAAEFIRRRALGYRLPQPPVGSPVNAAAATALIRLGVNLNQMTRVLNTTGEIAPDLSALIARIEGELDRLYGSPAH